MRKGRAVCRARSSVLLNSSKYNPGLNKNIIKNNYIVSLVAAIENCTYFSPKRHYGDAGYNLKELSLLEILNVFKNMPNAGTIQILVEWTLILTSKILISY